MASSGALKGALCFGFMTEMSEFGVWCPYNPKEALKIHPDHPYYPVEKECQFQSVIHNCILFQVIVSYLIFGTFMGPLRSCLLGKDHERKDIGKEQTLKTFQDVLIDHKLDKKHGHESGESHHSHDEDHPHEFVHPNE
jgi:hypothetical protein